MIRSMVLGLSMLLLAACSGTGPGSGTDQGTVPTTLDSFGFNPLPLPENVAGGFSWTVNGTRLTCRVDVDNNGVNEYTVENCTSSSRVAHTYGSQGTYVAKLTVSGEDGQSKSKLLTINVGPANIPPVIPSLVVAQSGGADQLQVTFDWRVSDANADITQCKFDAESDGQIDYAGLCSGLSAASQPGLASMVSHRFVHKYQRAGQYTATLEAADPYASTRATILVRIGLQPVIEQLEGSNPMYRHGKVQFRVSHPNNARLTCTLNVGKLGRYTFDDCITAEKMFRNMLPGKYPVLLEVADSLGNRVSRSIELQIGARQIKAGTTMSCILTDDFVASCAGDNWSGQLGIGKFGPGKSRLSPIDDFQFVDIAPGGNHVCALDFEGKAYCWGGGWCGQLGMGDYSSRNSPQPVKGGHTFVQLLAEDDHTCGLTEDGDVYCWGRNDKGQLGNGQTGGSETLPQKVVGGRRFSQIGVGERHSCALDTRGEAYCWGKSYEGQLGNGTAGGGAFDYDTPQKVVGGLQFVHLAAGDYHNCALTAEGKAYCWGWNNYGSLGNGNDYGQGEGSPQEVLGGHNFVQLALGDYQSCGLTAQDELYCWGRNEEGQLGVGSFYRSNPVPQRVQGGHAFVQVDAGDNVECAMTVSGETYCWGKNESGNLAIGNTINQNRPQFVIKLP